MFGLSFFSVAMLAGLAVLVIPPLIHLLNRRRYETVEWGAMQFLQVSEVTRRRLYLEEFLLMLLRMGLLAALVLALAGPSVESQSRLLEGGRGNRDVVLVFDGSASMSYTGAGQSAQDRAQEWAIAFVQQLSPGDGVAVLQARQQAVPVLSQLTTDRERVCDHIRRLPAPGGSCDWPAVLQAAREVLKDGRHGRRDVIVLSDGQRQGWADADSLAAWKDVAAGRHGGGPAVWAVNLDSHRPKDPPNWSLEPLTTSRAVAAAEQDVTFRTAVRLHGPTRYQPPHRLRLEVNGQFVKNLAAPADAALTGGKVPLQFEHRLPKEPGVYLVSVVLEPDPPPGERPPGYVIRDHLPADNRQDYAEVVRALSVLIVDGDPAPRPGHRGGDFLRDALAPARDPTPVAQARVVSVEQFDESLLREQGDEKGPGHEPPRVVVLCNVAALTKAQRDALDRFIRQGGGVLVTLGHRADAGRYKEQLYRDGQGWLPARLVEAQGDETQTDKAVRPLGASLQHPALRWFTRVRSGGLETAWFARWWRVDTPGAGGASAVAALFHKDGLPFLVERPHGEGRVLLSTVPLDASWRTNVVDVPAYVPLLHELVYYLAGARVAEHNLAPGQPLRYRVPRAGSLEGLTLQPPVGDARPLAVDAKDDRTAFPAQVVQLVQGPIVVSEGLREAGVWKLSTAEQQTRYYVVRPDARESDLTPLGDAERKQVEGLASLTFLDDPEQVREKMSTTTTRVELWWWLLLGMIALLCGEVLLTLWIARNR